MTLSFQDWEKIETQEKTIWRNNKLLISQLISPPSTTYLLEATFSGNIAFLNLYLSYNGDIDVIDKKSRNGKSELILALHFAMMNDHFELTKILLLHNIKINQLDFNGQSPVFYAIFYRAYKSLRLLINFNTELNIQEYN